MAYFDPQHPEMPIEVRLAPLVRISGTNRRADSQEPIEWTCTYLNLPYDANDPLNNTRLAICGSYQARFEFVVPPGTYLLSASSDTSSLETTEERKIIVNSEQKDIHLDGLVLRPKVGGFDHLTKRSKARGTWGKYKENFGKPAPPWHLTDAKGISKDAKLSDFKGKWVVLYFWGPDCPPCLSRELPELMAFYDKHGVQRDRFEILAFCVDVSETLANIPALEKHLADVKRVLWSGKDLPFPVLLDRPNSDSGDTI